MKAIYLDTFAGISGNMFLGALLDAGFPFEVLESELKKLNIGEYELVYRQVNKLGIEAKYFNVLLPEEHEHHHEHEHCHEHEHHHEHEHCHEHENCHEHEHHHEHEHCHEHEHHHEDEHCHEHEHHHEDEHCHEHGHCHEHEHHHEHEHCHEHEHHHEHEHCHEHEHHHEHVNENMELPHTHHHHEHRNLHDVMSIINGSALSDSIKNKAEKVFRAIAVAEGKVHGKPLDEVHFHEVGAIDTIIDIVGTLLGLEYLGIERVYVGKVNTGHGYVKCAHGIMPVPAPATAEILQDFPQEKGIVAKEMTTPTGAALLKVLATVALEQPASFRSSLIAYGAGSREVEIPNVLRMFVGEDEDIAKKSLVEVACNIDDMPGEAFGYAIEKLLAAGALDAWAEPIVMKKSRPAYKLSLICEEAKLSELLEIVFTETTTLGVRYHKIERNELERSFVTVNLPEGEIKVKCGVFNGKVVTIAPEYADCAEAAKKSGLSLKAIMNEAREAAEACL